MSSREELERLGAAVRERFRSQKRVLSFDQYLDELLAHPRRHTRDAARYLHDCFGHYGHYAVQRPWGESRRYRLFDQDFVDGDEEPRARLVGNEELQGRFYRALSNFVREGRANRLLLLHGPNGSAKSTFSACLMRALEHYSSTEDGALYRFSWVFARGQGDKAIGFGSSPRRGGGEESYANLEHDKVSAKIVSEQREHPLLLLPLEERRELLRDAYAANEVEDSPPEWLWTGRLGRKNAEIFDALLTSYAGDLRKVLAHVQVERFYVSRRYRTGAVSIGPQMSVDARERQITADRTLADLPAALSSLSLYEAEGELVDGECGIIEFSDLLKRPLEAWKYLLMAIETGEVALVTSMLSVNSVLVASTNEVHLDAFRQHPEYNSFRARISLLRAGYLLDYRAEQEIYDDQIVPHVQRHVAPHATRVASLWAVLTRLTQAEAERYDDSALGKVVADLTPMEKAHVYADGTIPRRLDGDSAKLLRAGLAEAAREFEAQSDYEGKSGASPREIRTLLLDAAQNPQHACLSPVAVLEQVEALCETGDYDFLSDQPDSGYYDHRGFIGQVRDHWLEALDAEVRSSTGLVEASRHGELFARYVTQVSLWVKGERRRDPVTGEHSDPDQKLLERIEGILDVGDAEEFRKNLISVVAAHAIDNPGEEVDYAQVFPRHLERVRESYYSERREQVGALIRDMLALLSDDRLDAEAREQAEAALGRLLEDHGYCRSCARASLGELLNSRYA